MCTERGFTKKKRLIDLFCHQKVAVITMPLVSLSGMFCYFLSSFIPRFISNLYKCKPISTVGAEQVNDKIVHVYDLLRSIRSS